MSGFWLGFITGPFAVVAAVLCGSLAWMVIHPRKYPAWVFDHETTTLIDGRDVWCMHQHHYREDRWLLVRLARWHAKRSMRRCHAERELGIDNYAKYDVV